MPSFNLTSTQIDIIHTWLYEPSGYLDQAINDLGVSAFEAWQADGGLDVTQWIRDNTLGTGLESDWNECSMIWWIFSHDKVNVPTPQIPSEAPQWVAILDSWDASINSGFARSPQNTRNTNSKNLYGTDQQISGTIPSGSHLAQQQLLINKVRTVLS